MERDRLISVLFSKKGKDADSWLEKLVEELNPNFICIDASLSLLSAYSEKDKDYFYRECDRILKGMSPMFIGGSTARDISPASIWRSEK